MKKNRPSGTRALVRNKMKEPSLRMVEWRAKNGERWAVARAKMQEKMSHWGASMKLGLFTATHPVHPMRRQAAKEAMKHKKIAATGNVCRCRLLSVSIEGPADFSPLEKCL